jgi:hypothetical protein
MNVWLEFHDPEDGTPILLRADAIQGVWVPERERMWTQHGPATSDIKVGNAVVTAGQIRVNVTETYGEVVAKLQAAAEELGL